MVLIILDSYDCVNCTPRFISSTNSIIECNPPKHHSKICNHERGENNPGHWPLHYPIAPSLSSSGTVIARIIHSRLHVDLAVHPAKTLLAIWSSEASFATISTIACLLPSSPSPTYPYLYRIYHYQLLRMDDAPWRRRPAAHSSASLAKTSSSPEAHEVLAS